MGLGFRLVGFGVRGFGLRGLGFTIPLARGLGLHKRLSRTVSESAHLREEHEEAAEGRAEATVSLFHFRQELGGNREGFKILSAFMQLGHHPPHRLALLLKRFVLGYSLGKDAAD